MNKLVNIDFNLTMNSLEVAKLTGKRHDHVLADIRKMLDELGIQPTPFSGVYKDQQLIDRPCYNLPKRETLILVSGYSIELRSRIIDRWQELELRLQRDAEEERQRVKARQQAKLENPDMTQAIKDMRAEQGKDDPFYIYSNENDLINRIAIGMTATKFRKEKGLSKNDAIRDHLPNQTIQAVMNLQNTNKVLIELGMDFEERKERLKELYERKFKQAMIQENARLDGY